MESVVPQASCLHRKHDTSRRDACGTCTTLADSSPASEYHESLNKAALLKAAAMAQTALG